MTNVLVCVKRVPDPTGEVVLTDDGLRVDGRFAGYTTSAHEEAAVALAVGAYVVVNTALVGAAIGLTRDGLPLRAVLGRWDDYALEVATVCMGALAAVALGMTPGLVALVLPPILVLHRAVLARQLEDQASTDGKTGLLTAVALGRIAGAHAAGIATSG